jgi:hypothetical protein
MPKLPKYRKLTQRNIDKLPYAQQEALANLFSETYKRPPKGFEIDVDGRFFPHKELQKRFDVVASFGDDTFDSVQRLIQKFALKGTYPSRETT